MRWMNSVGIVLGPRSNVGFVPYGPSYLLALSILSFEKKKTVVGSAVRHVGAMPYVRLCSRERHKTIANKVTPGPFPSRSLR